MSNIILVDDDQNILKVIKMRLEAAGYDVSTSRYADQAMELIKKETFDLALVDLKLIKTDGILFMEELHRIDPDLPVIILTAHGTIKTAVQAIQKGACTYITKPFDYQELIMQVEFCIDKYRLSKEVKRLRRIVRDKYGSENIIGRSEKMKKVLVQVAQVAEADSNVYINGESGTGKELIAKHVHLAGPRSEGPFIALNCAAIPETLIESELFGYERGAFTGAERSRKGLFAQADGGTLFLDEISEMPLTMQAKLLRGLEEKKFYPLGADKTVSVNARIISASNKNLELEVQEGRFREDLFYRIHVIVISLPPLRQRKEDIPLLAKHFLLKHGQRMNKQIRGFSPSTLKKLMAYDWPGNVRELENVVESSVAMTTEDIIAEDLILSSKDIQPEGLKFFKNAKEDFERGYLVQLLEIAEGNMSRAAKLAGKHRADLYELLKKHHLEAKKFRKH